MNLVEWVKDEVKSGVELWQDEKLIQQNGANVKGKASQRNLSQISSNSTEEWYRLCRLNAPVGTIIETYNETLWTELFNDTAALVRNDLTKCQLKECAAKSAKTLLSVLQKRNKDHWSDQVSKKEVDVKSNNDTDTTFTVVE